MKDQLLVLLHVHVVDAPINTVAISINKMLIFFIKEMKSVIAICLRGISILKNTLQDGLDENGRERMYSWSPKFWKKETAVCGCHFTVLLGAFKLLPGQSTEMYLHSFSI